ncbi:MAG: hypothetical protein K0R09_1283 [Clostridiales bacterium]|jgi:fluoroquinolone transport system permease protein|nr:hypothetical protein [Clostridiales bacterium]
MKQTFKLFKIGLQQTMRDGMLFALLPAPFLLGLFIKIVIPIADHLLQANLSFSLQPWYPLADAILIGLTPMFLGMVSAFIILDERDEGTGLYYQITPVEGYSYLLARIGLPMVWAFLCSVSATLLFGISHTPLLQIIFPSIISTFMGIVISMMTVSFAGNKVEGLAISKLSGISFLGLFAVWFAPTPYKYLGAILPSFWIGELVLNGSRIIVIIAGLVTCLFWVYLFTRRFLQKI